MFTSLPKKLTREVRKLEKQIFNFITNGQMFTLKNQCKPVLAKAGVNTDLTSDEGKNKNMAMEEEARAYLTSRLRVLLLGIESTGSCREHSRNRLILRLEELPDKLSEEH
jgi:hypothetical protein